MSCDLCKGGRWFEVTSTGTSDRYWSGFADSHVDAAQKAVGRWYVVGGALKDHARVVVRVASVGIGQAEPRDMYVDIALTPSFSARDA